MKDEAQGALARLKEIASRRDDGVAMCLWSEEARAILAHIAALEARAEKAEADAAQLREAVTWLLNCHRGLDRHGHGVGGDGYWSNVNAATAFAREALVEQEKTR